MISTTVPVERLGSEAHYANLTKVVSRPSAFPRRRRRGARGPRVAGTVRWEIGRHRYFHKLYALDITLDPRGATKSQIERAMQGHVLASAELIGTYQKGDR
jgi:phosphatidylethanolamine-binding protein (PEBP) family uncharacterized protein